MDLTDGYVIVLPRDEAKQFFGHREDEARLAFIRELLANDAIQRCKCNGNWQAMQETLAAVELENTVLAQALLGGRPLHQGDDYHVCLVRPDVVGFIAEQLGQVDQGQFGEWTEQIAEVHSIYTNAAELGGAVVFVAKVA